MILISHNKPLLFFFNIKFHFTSAVWLDVYSWSWYQAQSFCRLNGSTIVATSRENETFWTKYYKRRSHWIAVLGYQIHSFKLKS